jgi:hypothetical protein
MGRHIWTPAEDARLRHAYAQGGLTAARAAFPDASEASIYHRANRLKIPRRRWWTAAEAARQGILWGSPGLTLAALAKEFRRPPLAIYAKAHQLGLRRGVPDGYISISEAARRCGMERKPLLDLFRRSNVPTYETLARPTASKYRFRYVDPDLAEKAVAAWTRTEILDPAARARGMCATTLRAILIAAGHRPPRRHTFWRLRTADIDAAVASRPEHINVAAARHGVTNQTLSGWLVAAGVMVKGSRQGLPSDVIDRVVAAQRGRKGLRAWIRRPVRIARAA